MPRGFWVPIAIAFGGALMTCVAGMVACLRGAGVTTTAVIMAVATVPSFALGSVWALRLQRELGLRWEAPKAAVFGVLAAIIVANVGGLLCAMRVHLITGSRLDEAMVALIIAIPSSVIAANISLRLGHAPRRNEADLLRFSFWCSVVTFCVLFVLQFLAIAVPERHVYSDLQPLEEFNIALRFVVLGMLPAGLMSLWRRLRLALNTYAV